TTVGDQPLLLVDLQQPLDSSGRAQLTLLLRPAPGTTLLPESGGAEIPERTTAFPLVVPQGASMHKGVFAVSVDPGYRATVLASVPPARPSTGPDGPDAVEEIESTRPSSRSSPAPLVLTPWEGKRPDYSFPYG